MRKRLQRFGNLFVIGLLRSPFHRLASGSILLLTYRGRRSGRRFTIPVAYAEQERTLSVFVGHPERKTWWRNLRDGAEVEQLTCSSAANYAAAIGGGPDLVRRAGIDHRNASHRRSQR